MTEPQAFWQATPDEALRTLAATRDGLSSNEAATRLDRDGPNEISAAKQRHLLIDLLHATVLRDGKPIELPVRELVAGDIVTLAAGDLVPADGIVLAENGAQVNEALLTGEPYPVEKQVEPATAAETPADAHNALFHGTSLIGGTATMLVVQTGPRTRFGAIARSLAGKQPPTAFEHGIHKLGVLIVRLTIFLVLFVLLAHLALGRPPLQSFLFAMALAVGRKPKWW